MALAETAELAVRISLKDNVSAGVGRLQRNLGGLSKSIGQVGKGFGQVGAGLTRAGLVVGGAAVAGITAAAKAAIDYEDAFAGVRKTVDATKPELDALSATFRRMATEIPISASEFARLGEIAGALGIKVDAIDEFAEVTAKLGVTTDLTADQAADALGRIGNILRLSSDEFDNFGSALVRLGNTGASTEPEIIEITKRFAAAGKQAGLAAPEILGFAEAAASFTGLNEEAAGSSLSRFTAILTKVTAGGGAKFKLLNKIVGEDFRKALDTDASGALIKFLSGLRKLDKYERAGALKELGLDSVYLRQLLGGLVDNIDGVEASLRNADEGWRGNFLNKEAEVRFGTIASKIQLLKQNLIEAGITLGEGFAPAVGRAAEKLSAFLRQDENRSRLSNLGKEIGDAIDSIDWNAVLTAADQFVGILKGALSFAKLMYDAFSALPGPIKEATAGFLVLNKLSGNLLAQGGGNILGGLLRGLSVGIAAKVPGVGSLFAQPVYVTNWSMIAGGGALNNIVKGGALAVSLTAATLTALAAALAVGVAGDSPTSGDPDKPPAPGQEDRRIFELERRIEFLRRQDPNSPAFPGSTTVDRTVSEEIAKLTAEIAQLRTGGINGVTPGWTDKLRQSAADFKPPDAGGRELMSTTSVDAAILRGIAAGFKPTRAAGEATVQRNLERLAQQNLIKQDAIKNQEALTTGAALVTAAAVQALDRNQRPPVVNVTTNVNVSPAGVVHKYVIIRRSGPTGGSRERSGPLEFG